MGDENSLQGRTQAHKHESASSTGGYLAEGLTGITGGNAGEVLTATATDIPVWQSAGASAGAFNIEGFDTEAVLTSQLQVTTTDQDFYQVFYNISTDASATDPTHFGIRLNGVSTSTYRSVKVQAVNVSSPTTEELNLGNYWRLSANLYNNVDTGCIGVITIYKSQTGQLAQGAWYRDTSGNSAVYTGNTHAEYITYSQGVNDTITGAITSIELMCENASIKGSMQVNSMSWTS